MTAKREIRHTAHRARPRPLSAGTVAFSLMSTLSFFLVLFCGEAAIAAMKNSLSLCAKSVIPSLFPFMVVSELVVRSGAGAWLGRLCAPLLRRTFGISEAGSTSVLLGTLCGFPVGAKSAASLCDTGHLSHDELSRLLCFCNQPSSAFVTSAVGISLFGSYRFGLLLYGITLLSALLIGLFVRLLIPSKAPSNFPSPTNEKSSPPRVSLFTDAVSGAAHGMLTVCAFVCFFGTLVACLETLPAVSKLPSSLSALLVGFFELTGGVARAAAHSSPLLAAYAAAWCLGWSGLSVHFQIMCLCNREGVSFRPYFVAKAAQGALNVALLYAVLKISPSLAPSAGIPSGILLKTKTAWMVWCGAVLAGSVIAVWRWGKKHRFTSKIRQKSRTVGAK